MLQRVIYFSANVINVLQAHRLQSWLPAVGLEGRVTAEGAQRNFLERWRCFISWLGCLLHECTHLSSTCHLKCETCIVIKLFWKQNQNQSHEYSFMSGTTHICCHVWVLRSVLCCTVVYAGSHSAIILAAPKADIYQVPPCARHSEGAYKVRELHLAKGYHKSARKRWVN